MIHSISNDILKVEIESRGAELRSVKRADGCEYLWQGDAKYWEDRAPVLFPICSSLFGGAYTCRGKEYKLGMHGFAQYTEFEVNKKSETELVFTISSNDDTKAVYPFDFIFELTYTLCDETLTASARIINTGDVTLPATFGAHPGFNVPLTAGVPFESYRIEFAEPCEPDRIILSDPDCFVMPETEKLELEDGRIIRLDHSLFKPDGIFMGGMSKEVSLISDADERSVTMKMDDMSYFGIWQEYGADTPFICLEPWCAPPTNDGKTREDLATKKGLFKIEKGETKTVSYSLIFN
ncbi:MAG: aldose 1-epimerase family protein [Clostridia bacterium]|nr:aldose 1-epimerase family protein [Clostridia bacterium]